MWETSAAHKMCDTATQAIGCSAVGMTAVIILQMTKVGSVPKLIFVCSGDVDEDTFRHRFRKEKFENVKLVCITADEENKWQAVLCGPLPATSHAGVKFLLVSDFDLVSSKASHLTSLSGLHRSAEMAYTMCTGNIGCTSKA